jgi:Ni,Fe-hydrogenase III component G
MRLGKIEMNARFIDRQAREAIGFRLEQCAKRQRLFLAECRPCIAHNHLPRNEAPI